MEQAIRGIVVGIDGRTSSVRLFGESATVRCGIRGAMKDAAGPSSRLAVGDHVALRPFGPGAAVIEAILPRRTKLARGRGRKEQVIAANVDQAAIVASARDPSWRPGLVDRMLCAAEKGGLEPLIVANKCDLVEAGSAEAAALRHDLEVYRGLGYRTLETSARSGAGMGDLGRELRDRLTVFAGQSGVGKSSLLNALEAGFSLATREVSRGTRKGRHTTAGAALLPLPGGGLVLDTPGIRAFAFYRLEADEVGWLFRDVARIAPSCRFRDCLHLDEPECAVRYAAETGVIDPRRYESYRRILASLDGEDERD